MFLVQHIGVSAGLQAVTIALKQKSASISRACAEMAFLGCEVNAGCQANQIVCVRQRIGFVEVIDTPNQPSFRIAPGSEILDVKVSYTNNDWGSCRRSEER